MENLIKFELKNILKGGVGDVKLKGRFDRNFDKNFLTNEGKSFIFKMELSKSGFIELKGGTTCVRTLSKFFVMGLCRYCRRRYWFRYLRVYQRF